MDKVEAPAENVLDGCTMDQSAKITVYYYSIDAGDERVKETVKANFKFNLLRMKVFGYCRCCPPFLCLSGSLQRAQHPLFPLPFIFVLHP